MQYLIWYLMQIKIVNRFINDLHKCLPILFFKAFFCLEDNLLSPRKQIWEGFRAGSCKWVRVVILWVGLTKQQQPWVSFSHIINEGILCAGHWAKICWEERRSPILTELTIQWDDEILWQPK